MSTTRPVCQRLRLHAFDRGAVVDLLVALQAAQVALDARPELDEAIAEPLKPALQQAGARGVFHPTKVAVATMTGTIDKNA